jgi:hypothetical protein
VESRTDKGTGLSYVESAAAASGPPGAVPCGSDGTRWSDCSAPLGAAARHAVPRSTATLLDEWPDRYRYSSRMPEPIQRCRRVRCSLVPCLANLGSEAVAPWPDGCRRLVGRGVCGRETGRRHDQLHRRACVILASSSTQSRAAASRCRGTRHRSGTPSFVRHGTRPTPRSRVAGPRRADAHVRPPSGWTCHTARSGCAASGFPLLGTRSPSLARGAARSHRTGSRRPGGRGRAMDGASGEIGSPR